MKKILVTTSTFGEYNRAPIEMMEKEGFTITFNPYKRKLCLQESFQLYTKDIDGVIAGTESIPRKVLEQAENLKVISRCGTGMDNVDLETARRKNILLYNTPEGPTRAVAELTVALMLNLLRRVNTMDAALKAGMWDKLTGNLLYGKKVGIIGFGRIGKKVAELLSVFGAELAYSDIAAQAASPLCGAKKLIELLPWADIITVHVSASDESSGPLLGSGEFRLMKKGAWLVNVSRGGVLDEAVLYECLKNGRIAGAALDVFEHEPYSGKLRELDTVILTPHIGSYAQESRVLMEMEAVENLIKGLKERGVL